MIDNRVVQADLIAAMKADGGILAYLASVSKTAANIKEADYAGRDFDYPGLRLDLGQQRYIPDRGHCEHTRLDFAVAALSERDSSREADLLIGLVNDLFHSNGQPKIFKGTGWYSYLRSVGLVSAFRTGEKTWSALAQFGGVVYLTS